ncbi:MAG: HlyC/CorC family transporter [Spirochaetaceae bacterium]|nr:HlyC/CorC family transporter [Spirochaetaceae bacterium]
MFFLMLFVLILLSAFFAASETAFVALSKINVRQMIKERRYNARLIEKLKKRQDLLLTTILVGSNLVNNLASALTTAIIIAICGDSGIGLATLIMTVLIIIFCEIIPKTAALLQKERTAQLFAPVLLFFEILFSPVSIVFAGISKGINFFSGIIWKKRIPIVTEEELKTLIKLGSQEGIFERSESRMLDKIFEFTDLRVYNVMTDRSFVKALPVDSSFDDTLKMFKDTGFSRILVFVDDIDSIIGYVDYCNLLFYKKDKNYFSLKESVQDILFVPKTNSAVSLLKKMTDTNSNIAVAVDEQGCNSGIVTRNDLLTAVFGHLSDEYAGDNDIPVEDQIDFISPHEFRIPGDMFLTDVNDIFNLHLESEYYQTVAGWMLERLGELPPVGTLVRTEKALFIVEAQYRRRIQVVRLKLII